MMRDPPAQGRSGMRVMLIDGLNLVRRIFAGVPGEEGAPEHDADVLDAAQRSLSRALEQVGPTHAVLAFEAGGPTWRHRLEPEYKQGRPPMPEALVKLLPRIEAAFAGRGVRAVRVEGFEADDVIASVAVRLAGRVAEVVVLSTDRGLLPLLGHGVRLRHHFDERDLDAAYVRERFGVDPEGLPTYLALVGDRATGIPGVPSVGAKTAAKLVQGYGDMEAILAAAPELPGRAGKALREHGAAARLSLELVSLRTDVELGLNLGDFRVEPHGG